MTDQERLYYLDNLKVFLIFLVIVHHVGQAYGATGGGWPYSYPGDRVQALRLFFRFNASFFMGLFFFISGYFLPSSFDRRGARKFITDKLIRFGIPLLLMALFILPVMEYAKYVHYTAPIGFADFYIGPWLGFTPQAADHHRLFNFAHLWFVEHLLVYSILYAAIRMLLQSSMRPALRPGSRTVQLHAVILYIVALGAVTHLMRTSWGFPIDRWIFLGGFIQAEPAHIPQYLSLFVFGILAYRYSFLDSIARPHNLLWFVPGLGLYIITIIQFFSAGRPYFNFLWEYREAILCVGVCIGLLALFKTYFNRTGRLLQMLAGNAYGAYVFHVPLVVALQYAFDPVPAGAFTLFIIVSLLGIPGSFLISFLIRMIPGMKRIL